LLQTSVEHVTDIGAHLLSGDNLAVPENHYQIIKSMGQMGVLPHEFAERIAPMARFRNIVVHHYLTIDPLEVEKILKNHLDDFSQFIEHIYNYLHRKGYLPIQEE
jgi:uncharacterized protein YutE (UPF0331/DUF86 family)